MITTIEGQMDEALFDKREGSIDNENEITSWVEYWRGDTLMHRSVHVHMKKPMVSMSDIGGFGG
jgi:hypothetical protein